MATRKSTSLGKRYGQPGTVTPRQQRYSQPGTITKRTTATKKPGGFGAVSKRTQTTAPSTGVRPKVGGKAGGKTSIRRPRPPVGTKVASPLNRRRRKPSTVKKVTVRKR